MDMDMGSWDLASPDDLDALVAPPHEDVVKIRIWCGPQVRFKAVVGHLLNEMLERRWHPECRTRTALTRLALRNLVDQFSKEVKDPESARAAANLVAEIDAEDLSVLMQCDQRLYDTLIDVRAQCTSDHQRMQLLAWGMRTVEVMQDPEYQQRFSHELEGLKSRLGFVR